MAKQPKSEGNEHTPPGDPVWKSIRRSKVARARKLLADPDYPSKKVMQAVGELLARKLGKNVKRKS